MFRRKGDNGSDVGRVKGTLCGMFCVVPANMGMMERIAGGFGVHGQGVCVCVCVWNAEIAIAGSWSGPHR